MRVFPRAASSNDDFEEGGSFGVVDHVSVIDAMNQHGAVFGPPFVAGDGTIRLVDSRRRACRRRR